MSTDRTANGMSRRAFVGGAAALAAGAATALGTTQALARVPSNASSAAGESQLPSGIEDDPYFAKPDPIDEVDEVKDYEVVVVGAGCSGVPAACAAVDAGARVALLQKSPRVYSHGVKFSGWNAPRYVEERGFTLDDEEIRQLEVAFIEETHYGCRPGLIKKFFDNCPEAIDWQLRELEALGEPVKYSDAEAENRFAWTYRVNNQVSLSYGAIAQDYIDNRGLDAYFSTPALQLVQDDGGTVTGVVAQDRDGRYIRFNASKGVILATGGYAGNRDLVARWLPECVNIPNGCYPQDNTGDGALMAIWAGGTDSPLKGKKLDVHHYADHAARTSIMKIPFLLVNDRGVRIGNENAPSEHSQANYAIQNPSVGTLYYCIFDGSYADVLAANGQEKAILSPEQVEEYEAEVPRTLLWEAPTLEELAEKIGVPADQLAATCERYGELAEQGEDADFLKEASWLYKLETPPFYAMARTFTIGGTLGAVKVNDDCVAVRKDGSPIGHLYVVGNDMGCFQTAQDYAFDDYGFTCTSATVFGYAVGRDVALS